MKNWPDLSALCFGSDINLVIQFFGAGKQLKNRIVCKESYGNYFLIINLSSLWEVQEWRLFLIYFGSLLLYDNWIKLLEGPWNYFFCCLFVVTQLLSLQYEYSLFSLILEVTLYCSILSPFFSSLLFCIQIKPSV